jgi:uridine phosphorylase
MGSDFTVQRTLSNGRKIYWAPSPNYNSRGNYNIDHVMIHYTGGSKSSALNWLTNPKSKVSAHYVIDKQGNIYQLVGEKYNHGITISSNGFYGPQGRVLRLQTADAELNNKLHTFSYQGRTISNYEMESSALLGLSKMLGHNAATVCLIIANRVTKNSISDYHPLMKELILDVLNKVTK